MGPTPGWRCSLLLAWPGAMSGGAQQRPGVPVPAPASPFWGGVPTGTARRSRSALSLYDALKRALAHNLGVLSAEEAVERADGARRIALSELLPNVRGSVSEARRKTNLEAFGFPLQPPFPRVVGPFNVFDARVFLRQSVLDLRAINAERAEAHRLAAARFSYRSARDLIVLVAANLYLEAVAAGARVEAARAQLETARALHSQALDLRQRRHRRRHRRLRAEVRLSTRAAARDRGRRTTSRRPSCSWRAMIGLPLRQAFTLGRDAARRCRCRS